MTEGRIFDGYKITREAIARGSVGIVHEAVSPDGKRVAIKVLDRRMVEESAASHSSEIDLAELTRRAYETNVERFKEEYQTIVGLKHINVAEVYRIGFFEDQLYIVSEFIEGKPIAEYVRGWQPVKMVPLFVQVLEGLDFIHRNGLIHLDIKSHNILVSETKGEPIVKIIDFGMAMKSSEYEGLFMGTPSYIAPEVAFGRRELVDRRADLFSFGVLMYHCITWGSHPFARPKGNIEILRQMIERKLMPHPPSYSHTKKTADVPEYLDIITMRLLEYDPRDRFYTNARTVVNALITHAPDTFTETLEAKGSYLCPIGDRHIGNESEQSKVYAAIDALASGETPLPAVVEINGPQGTGKSHLLKKIKEHAEKHADKLAIKKIELPADESALKRFSDDITLWASENKQPAVVLVDNCHREESAGGGRRGDPVSPIIQNLLNSITSRQSNPALYSGQQPLLVAFTSSPNIPSPLAGEGWEEGGHFTISLSPFTLAELKNYLTATPAFAGKDVPEEFISKLHAATRGIQAEVDEHLRERNSDGMLFNLDGEILISDFKDHEKAPATMEARLQKTYDGLLPEEKKILDFLSVWGLKQVTPPPDFKTISHLISSPLVALHLNNLLQTQIVCHSRVSGNPEKNIIGSPTKALGDDKPAYSFTNNYFSTFIYNQLDEKTKTRLHDSIAKYLSSFLITIPSPLMGEGQGEGDLKNAPLLHQGLGSNKTLAIKSLVKLAKTTLYDKGRADLAAWLVERAISVTQPLKLKLRIYLDCLLAETLFYKGNLDKVERILNENLVNISKTNISKSHLETLAQIWLTLNLSQQKRFDEAATVIEECLGRYCKIGISAFYPRLLNLKAWNLYRQSFVNHREAVALLEKSSAIYQSSRSYEKKLPSQTIKRINTNNLGIVLRVLGKLSEAAIELENNLSKRNHTIFSKLVSLIAITETYRMLGEYEKAEQYGKTALGVAASSGLGEWLMHTHWTLFNLYHDMDHFDESIEEGRRYLALSCCIEDKQNHNQTLIYSWVHMGHCYKEKKDWDNALLHFEAAIDANAKGQHLMSAYLGMGEVFFSTGKSEKALDYLSRAMGVLEELPKNAITASHEKRMKEITEKINGALKSRAPA